MFTTIERRMLMMNKYNVLVLTILSVFTSGCWTTVGPGEAGIKFNKAGNGKGLDDITLASGWVFSGPMTEVIVFPTTVQTTTWTKDVNEGSPTNDELTFQAKQGETFHADVSLSFRVNKNNVVKLYREFRMRNLETLADKFIRTRVRDALNRTSVQYTADMLAGPARPKLQDEVRAILEKDLGEHGISVTELSFNGEFRYPKKIKEALENATRQIQEARAAENKVRQVQMEAKQRVAQAEGEATAKKTEAEGFAQAQLIRAKAEAEAIRIKLKAQQEFNEMVSRTTTTQVLKARQLEKWDGVMPRVLTDSKASVLLNTQ